MSRHRCPVCLGLTLTIRVGALGRFIWCRNACDRATILAALNGGQLALGDGS